MRVGVANGALVPRRAAAEAAGAAHLVAGGVAAEIVQPAVRSARAGSRLRRARADHEVGQVLHGAPHPRAARRPRPVAFADLVVVVVARLQAAILAVAVGRTAATLEEDEPNRARVVAVLDVHPQKGVGPQRAPRLRPDGEVARRAAVAVEVPTVPPLLGAARRGPGQVEAAKEEPDGTVVERPVRRPVGTTRQAAATDATVAVHPGAAESRHLAGARVRTRAARVPVLPHAEEAEAVPAKAGRPKAAVTGAVGPPTPRTPLVGVLVRLQAAGAVGPAGAPTVGQGREAVGADRHDRQTLLRPHRHVAAKRAGQVPPGTAPDVAVAAVAATVAEAADAEHVAVAHAAVPAVPRPEGAARADDQASLAAGAGEAGVAAADAPPAAGPIDRAQGAVAACPVGAATAGDAGEGFAEVDDLGPLAAGPARVPVPPAHPALADPPSAGPDGPASGVPLPAVRARRQGRADIAGITAVPDDPRAALAVLHAGAPMAVKVRAAGPPVAPRVITTARGREARPEVDDQRLLPALVLEVAAIGAADPGTADPFAVHAQGPFPGPRVGASAALPAEARALLEGPVALIAPLHRLRFLTRTSGAQGRVADAKPLLTQVATVAVVSLLGRGLAFLVAPQLFAPPGAGLAWTPRAAAPLASVEARPRSAGRVAAAPSDGPGRAARPVVVEALPSGRVAAASRPHTVAVLQHVVRAAAAGRAARLLLLGVGAPSPVAVGATAEASGHVHLLLLRVAGAAGVAGAGVVAALAVHREVALPPPPGVPWRWLVAPRRWSDHGPNAPRAPRPLHP